MVFLGKYKNMAQKLQSLAIYLLLSVLFVFPASGLFANESDLPVIIPNDELLSPIELRDGLVYEVTVDQNTEIAFETSSGNEGESSYSKVSAGMQVLAPQFTSEIFCSQFVMAKKCETSSQEKPWAPGLRLSIFENESKQYPVKSIANSGLFGFLGICLSRSELPSKNFSTQCENSLPKSMTRRSANDWKFLWPPVRMTSLWLSSINSFRMLKTSIRKPSMNPTPSMSDISSTWSNAMEEFLVTLLRETKTEIRIPVAPNRQENNKPLLTLNQSALPQNQHLL